MNSNFSAEIILQKCQSLQFYFSCKYHIQLENGKHKKITKFYKGYIKSLRQKKNKLTERYITKLFTFSLKFKLFF